MNKPIKNKIKKEKQSKEFNLFHTILDKIADEVMVIDNEGIIRYINNATVKGLGFPKSKILYKYVTKFFKERITPDRWKATYFDNLKKSKKPISMVVDRINKQGKIQKIDINAVYMKHNSHEFILSVARDFTDKFMLLDRLHRTQDRYKMLIEQAAEAILTLDLEGNIVYANEAAEKTFNIPLSDSKGTHFLNYIESSSVNQALEFFRDVKRGQLISLKELNAHDNKGNIIPIEVSISPVLRNGKMFQIQVILHDISRRKNIESILRESEKNQAIHNFLLGTAQEIEKPLQGLLISVDSFLNRYKERDFEYIGYREFTDIMNTVESMHKQIKYCHDTTVNMLKINKRKVGIKGDLVDINITLKEVVKNLSHSMEISNLKLKLNLTEKLPRAVIGELEFNQVATNIITNAIQSIPAINGGEIKISTRKSQNENYVYFECVDNGIGIPKENLPHIFEPFFTTKQRGVQKSTGLGLAIVYSIIKTFHGDIEVKSTPNTGTQVIIKLPFEVKIRSKK